MLSNDDILALATGTEKGGAVIETYKPLNDLMGAGLDDRFRSRRL